MMRTLAAVLVVGAIGCGGAPAAGTDAKSGGGDGAIDGRGTDGGGGGGSDAAIGSDGFQPLIGRDWTMAAGNEGYKCTRIAVTQDLWIDGFRALSPLGTHHEVLTISDSSSPLGDYDCDAGSLDTKMLYAAGLHTDDLIFPAGVAIHITPGQYLNLNLHLFDQSEKDYADHSGVSVHTIAAADVVNEADMEFSGTFHISVAADDKPHTAVGGCTAPAKWHIFTLWPHMHQIAQHQSLTVTHAGVTTTLLDVDYQFAEQKNYPIADTLIHAGDAIQTTCTYVNDTGSPIGFSESSSGEMCFTGMYKYPADGNTFGCTDEPGF